MAKVVISGNLNFFDVSTWYGDVAYRSSSELEIANGSLLGIYTGAFSYDSEGNLSGTLTGYEEEYGGVPIFTASGLDLSASTAETYIENDQIQSLLQIALAGDDQFSLSPGTHVIDGYAGYNTAAETGSYASYTVSGSSSVLSVASPGTNDEMYNIQGVYFSDGFYDALSQKFFPDTPSAGYAALDTSTHATAPGGPQTYSGPVPDVQDEYVSITTDNLNVSISTDNWFVHTGSGNDAIAVQGGTNVLDGGTGSNFLTGGSGFDTFFVDDRAATSDIWSTVVNFHANDAATIWGVTPQDFALTWVDGQGAAGYTGFTLHATAAGQPTASLTLAGFSSADLTSGRLVVSYGTDPSSGSPYMYVTATS